jgi:hypothetical protein
VLKVPGGSPTRILYAKIIHFSLTLEGKGKGGYSGYKSYGKGKGKGKGKGRGRGKGSALPTYSW